MGNAKRYAKFQENLFSGNEIKSIFCPPLFRKLPIIFLLKKCEQLLQILLQYLS